MASQVVISSQASSIPSMMSRQGACDSSASDPPDGPARSLSVLVKQGLGDDSARVLNLRALRIMTLRSPPWTRLMRVATRPNARVSRASRNSRTAAWNTGSPGVPRPSHSASSRSVSGSASATTGSWMLRVSIAPRGAMKVTPMKASSGSTSAQARSPASFRLIRGIRCCACWPWRGRRLPVIVP